MYDNTICIKVREEVFFINYNIGCSSASQIHLGFVVCDLPLHKLTGAYCKTRSLQVVFFAWEKVCARKIDSAWAFFSNVFELRSTCIWDHRLWMHLLADDPCKR